MDDNIATYILTVLGGAGLWQLVIWVLNRRRDKTEQAAIVINTKETAVNTEKLAAEKEKLAAETEQVNITNRKTEAEYLRESNDSILAQLGKLQLAMETDRTSTVADKAASTAEIANIKAAQEEGLRRYEERAGSLVAEIKQLSDDLKAANVTIGKLEGTIKENNVTITVLQGEVKTGNEKIAALQDVITNLNQKVTDLMERLLDLKKGD